MQQLNTLIETYLKKMHMPTTIHATDVVEIIILTFLCYYILAWIKNTKAWALLKGVIVIAIFIMHCGNRHRGGTAAGAAQGTGRTGTEEFLFHTGLF